MKTINRAIALAAIAALTACGGGTPPKTPVTPSTPAGTTSAGSMFSNMVGVGDSLTAGYQSGGLLGVNVTGNAVSATGIVPAGQYNGYWALLYEQATGASAATVANPATSVLPLIAGPGIGAQLVITADGFPGDSHSGCDSFNQAAYSLSNLGTVRLNPNAGVRDFGVPGITAHEAVNMYAPITTTCQAPVGSLDPTAPLVGLLDGESANFYPVLGGSISRSVAQKLNNGQPSSEVNAAAAVKPTFATVWLGANDLLHFVESGGAYAAVDVAPGQMQADITQAIVTEQKAGAQGVAVANLPTVLETPQFFRGGNPASTDGSGAPALAAVCGYQNWLYCDLYATFSEILAANGEPAANIPTVAGGNATAVVEQLEAVGPNPLNPSTTAFANDNGWYVMEGGYFSIIQQVAAAGFNPANYAPTSATPLDLDISSSGVPDAAGTSSLGQNYVTDALATTANALNAQWNSEIAAAATATGSALVDVNAIFNGIYGGPTGTGAAYFDAAIVNPTINPETGAPICCTLVFEQGLTSLDGIHPSNTGYGLLANAFIAAIDAKYSASIAPVNLETIYASDPYAPQAVGRKASAFRAINPTVKGFKL